MHKINLRKLVNSLKIDTLTGPITFNNNNKKKKKKKEKKKNIDDNINSICKIDNNKNNNNNSNNNNNGFLCSAYPLTALSALQYYKV